ncbi:TIGR02391 family protein [Streptomyces niveus]|uniref:TIGR02391 family protein n=1 Tax=Streptomyces niveus TaxID=193462 RepID=UPI0036E38258
MSASKPVGMPRPNGDEGYALIAMIWAFFRDADRWPTFDEVDRKLWRDRSISFEDAIGQIPPGVLWGIDLDMKRRPPQSIAPIQLTLAGAANCDGSDPEVSALLGIVRLASKIERDWESPHPPSDPQQPFINFETVRSYPGFGSNLLPRAGVLFRAVLLAMNEPWSRSFSNNPEEGYEAWQLGFDRGIRPFEGVSSLAEYWDRRQRVLAPDSQAWPTMAIDASASPMVEESLGSASSMLASLHPDVEIHAGELFRAGFLKQAVFAMCGRLEHRIQGLVDPVASGRALMHKAFAVPKMPVPQVPQLNPTRAKDDFTRVSEQEGYMFLFSGMMAALRNTGGHGDYPVYSEEEAYEALAFLSLLSRRLDLAAERKSAGSEGEQPLTNS